MLKHRNDIRDLTDKGIEVLIDGLRWGTSYHGCGWNPRHIEGIDHFFFYSLEYLTGKKFLHGQPVCLGVYIGSLLHNSRADEMLHCMHDIGLDIRPEAMGVTWQDAAQALFKLRDYVQAKGAVVFDRPRYRNHPELRRSGEARYRECLRDVEGMSAGVPTT